MAIAMTVEAILARHHPAPSYGTEPPICTWCEQNWPCEVAVVANDGPVVEVARAAEALVEGLTNYVSYSSGKWQAGGAANTLDTLVVLVVRWQKERARIEREQAEATEPQAETDAREFMRATLG